MILSPLSLAMGACGAATGTPWTPTVLGAGLRLWLDASDQDTITAIGGDVSQWDDLGPFGHHAAQPASANRPVSGLRAINGLNTLDFNGATTWMNLPDGTIDYDATLIVTVCQPDISATRRILSNLGVSGIRGYAMNQGIDFGDGTLTLPSLESGVPMLLAFVVEGTGATTQSVIRNGDSSQSISGAITRTGLNVNQNLGSHGNGNSSFFDGAMGEIIVVTGTTSTSVRERIEGYLAHKWGLAGALPANHSYKSTVP